MLPIPTPLTPIHTSEQEGGPQVTCSEQWRERAPGDQTPMFQICPCESPQITLPLCVSVSRSVHYIGLTSCSLFLLVFGHPTGQKTVSLFEAETDILGLFQRQNYSVLQSPRYRLSGIKGRFLLKLKGELEEARDKANLSSL